MSLPQGINFRTTAGYVTDGPNDDAEAFTSGVAGTTYPRVTVQGNTVGWESAGTVVTRDRNASNDARLAGLHNSNDINGVITYRVDLPGAGAYEVTWASGDGSYTTGTAVDLYDGSTRLQALSVTPTAAANHFRDATNIDRSAASWVTDNVTVTAIFASTILRLTSVPNGADNMNFTHVSFHSAEGRPVKELHAVFPKTLMRLM